LEPVEDQLVLMLRGPSTTSGHGSRLPLAPPGSRVRPAPRWPSSRCRAGGRPAAARRAGL